MNPDADHEADANYENEPEPVIFRDGKQLSEWLKRNGFEPTMGEEWRVR